MCIRDRCWVCLGAVSRNDEKCTEVRMQSIGLQWPARKKRSDLGWGQIVNGLLCLWNEFGITPVGNSWELRGFKAGGRLRFVSRRKIYWQQHMEVGRGWGKPYRRETKITRSSRLTSLAICRMQSNVYSHIYSGLIDSRYRSAEKLSRGHSGNRPNL